MPQFALTETQFGAALADLDMVESSAFNVIGNALAGRQPRSHVASRVKAAPAEAPPCRE